MMTAATVSAAAEASSSAVDELTSALTANSFTSKEHLQPTLIQTDDETVILCDAGYGFPIEARPRKEKLLAVAKQIIQFLKWQQQQMNNKVQCLVKVVTNNQLDQDALRSRMEQLWKTQNDEELSYMSLPVEFHLNDDIFNDDTFKDAIYLSPDAPTVLDPADPPPSKVVVGMIIDRRQVQRNRSLQRANSLQRRTARLQLNAWNVPTHEPLNVDVVMETMQQWWWNHTSTTTSTTTTNHDTNDTDDTDTDDTENSTTAYQNAVEQALQRHVARHPNRPLHTTT